MKHSRSTLSLAFVAGVVLLMLLAWRAASRQFAPPGIAPAAQDTRPQPTPAKPAPSTASAAASERDGRIDTLLANLARQGGRDHEAVLTFKDAAAMRRFLDRAGALGLTILGRIDRAGVVRVRYDSLDQLAADLASHIADYAHAGINLVMQLPQPPKADGRALHLQVPVGNHLLPFLGVAGSNATWGRGVTIAVVDTGVAADPTFGQGRLRTLDIGLGTTGTAPGDGHATAVAALAAGQSRDAQGIAPAADILSIRATDAAGLSDSFTVSQAIFAAIDAGAQIVNVSLGGYAGSALLAQAIDYASAQGVVVVAAAGNDQAAQLTWPAADPRVISVGAVDALEEQANFSNSGTQLKLTAPGVGLQTAWLDGTRVSFDGTSGSAPVVAGSIAALMSQGSGLTAAGAAQILQRYSNDLGPAGADPAFGSGLVNLGWAMARDDTTRIDTAISSHNYNAQAGQMQFVVQNRSAVGVGALTLEIEINGVPSRTTINWMDPASSITVTVPVDGTSLENGAPLVFRSQLINPPSIVDAVPANNVRRSLLELTTVQ